MEKKAIKGTLFLSAYNIDRTKFLKSGEKIESYYQEGFSTCDEKDTPLDSCAVYVMGTRVTDKDGGIMRDTRLVRFIDNNGKCWWMADSQKGAIGCFDYLIKSGTENWKALCGSFKEVEPIVERNDGSFVVGLEGEYYFNEAERDLAIYRNHAQNFKYHDKGYSFHGPHEANDEGILKLKDGSYLEVGVQQGVLISENPDSPRSFATVYDRGTTVRAADGTQLGDVMLLEDVDVEGNMVWLYHEWWYDPEIENGTYDILGGTGKWEGIKGQGSAVGHLFHRNDDHWMTTWELSWDI